MKTRWCSSQRGLKENKSKMVRKKCNKIEYQQYTVHEEGWVIAATRTSMNWRPPGSITVSIP